MKLRLILASCVLALAACANVAQNGPNAVPANLIAGARVAYTTGKTLYDAGKLNDEEAEAIVLAIQSIAAYVRAAEAAEASGDGASKAAYLRLAADVLDQLTARLAAKKG